MLDPTHTGALQPWRENDVKTFFFYLQARNENQTSGEGTRMRRLFCRTSSPAVSWFLLWKRRDTARLRSARRRPFQHHTHKWGMLMRRRTETKRAEQQPLGDNEFTPHFSCSWTDASAVGFLLGHMHHKVWSQATGNVVKLTFVPVQVYEIGQSALLLKHKLLHPNIPNWKIFSLKWAQTMKVNDKLTINKK